VHSYRLAFRAYFRLSVNSRAAWARLFQTRNEAQMMGSKRFLIIGAAPLLALSWYSPLLSAQTRTSSTKQTDEAARAQNAAKSVYGKKTVAADTSKGRVGGAAIAVVQPFLRALQKYAPAELPKTTRKQ